MDDFLQELADMGIDRVINLATDDEIGYKSPSYREAITSNSFPVERLVFPIVDYGVPQNREDYLGAISEISQLIIDGNNLLIHCAAGIGRTGLTATCILIHLGFSLEEAKSAVTIAGSNPETTGQRELLVWLDKEIRG